MLFETTPPFLLPAHDAPDQDFTITPDKREIALKWARNCLADIPTRSDEDLMVACRLVIANTADHFHATQLLRVLRNSAAARARKAVGNA